MLFYRCGLEGGLDIGGSGDIDYYIDWNSVVF